MIVLAGLIALINVANLIASALNSSGQQSFAIYSLARASLLPLAGLGASALVFFVLFARKYWLATAWATLCLVPVIYEHHWFITAVRDNSDIPDLFPVILRSIDLAHILWSLLLFVLWVWLLGIVIRPFVRTANDRP